MIKRLLLASLLCSSVVATAARAEDEADKLQLESSTIRGNQELPKVLYIVPWKDPSLTELDGLPANRLVDEVLAPVDRDVFRRQQRFFNQLYPNQDSGTQ